MSLCDTGVFSLRTRLHARNGGSALCSGLWIGHLPLESSSNEGAVFKAKYMHSQWNGHGRGGGVCVTQHNLIFASLNSGEKESVC